MTSRVTLKAQPPQTIRFPGVCAHCGRTGSARMTVQRQIDRVTRLIDVPLCAACAQVLDSRSMDEERWQKMGWLATAVLGVLALASSMLLVPAAFGFGTRLLAGGIVGIVVGMIVFRASRAAGHRAMLPEKRTIHNAVRIAAFSGRTTTFEFMNEAFAERFMEMNREQILAS